MYLVKGVHAWTLYLARLNNSSMFKQKSIAYYTYFTLEKNKPTQKRKQNKKESITEVHSPSHSTGRLESIR